MRELRLPRPVLETIEREARETYPDEVCGFLFSAAVPAEDPVRSVVSAQRSPNEVDGERRRRFVISSEGLRTAELHAAARDEAVTGFYHSHPDHPALPSEFDTDHAWPWYTYLIVSVDRAGSCEAGAFELWAEGRRFRPCELRIVEEASEPPLRTAPLPGER